MRVQLRIPAHKCVSQKLVVQSSNPPKTRVKGGEDTRGSPNSSSIYTHRDTTWILPLQTSSITMDPRLPQCTTLNLSTSWDRCGEVYCKLIWRLLSNSCRLLRVWSVPSRWLHVAAAPQVATRLPQDPPPPASWSFLHKKSLEKKKEVGRRGYNSISNEVVFVVTHLSALPFFHLPGPPPARRHPPTIDSSRQTLSPGVNKVVRGITDTEP